jgi:hypothetical protein
MILKLNQIPDTLVGFVACDEVTKEDFEKVVIPAAAELVQRTGKLNYLLVVANTVKKRGLGMGMNAVMPALTRWNRAGIVTDVERMPWLTELFRKIIPVEFRVFEHNDIKRAVKWLGEQP